ncbi:MAG: carboxypeptidase-like regulatory domain-containing protein [Patescibacteria group bacterium]|nr:carboxypeptidase-like regulatory domain-containing protein [Patescibacteria group bacterium]
MNRSIAIHSTMPPLAPRLALACLLIAAGCGGPTIPCTGEVLLDGKPLPNAAVMFIPADGSRAATGKTDSAGCFRLTTFRLGDGAFPGEHRVTIAAFTPNPAKSRVAGGGGSGGGGEPGVDLDESPSGSGDGKLDFAPILWTAPERYASPEDSGLTAAVSGRRCHFTFDLKP